MMGLMLLFKVKSSHINFIPLEVTLNIEVHHPELCSTFNTYSKKGKSGPNLVMLMTCQQLVGQDILQIGKS
jgi:hypothetical protein